jgi:transcriptional antiterminator RfaH
MLPDETHWYVAYSKPHQEPLAQFHLRSKGLDVFFPQLSLPQAAQNHRRIVPLFPNYLFVRLRISDQSYFVIWSPGIRRLLGFGGVPSPVEDSVVSFLMQQSTSDGVIKARFNLSVGQEVRIKSGPFQGLVGIIQEPPNDKERVKILLTLLNRPIRLDLPVRFVDSGRAAYRPATSAAAL